MMKMGLKASHLSSVLLVLAFMLSSKPIVVNSQRNKTLFRRFDRFNFNLDKLESNDKNDPRFFHLPGPVPFPGQSPILDPPAPCLADPTCPNRPSNFYTADGSCNNLRIGARGQAGRPHKRLVPAAYANGIWAPRTGTGGSPLPSTRLVSTTMQQLNVRKSKTLSHIFVIWCQYLAHDITNTPVIHREGLGVDCRCRSRDPGCFNIQVPRNDTDIQYRLERRTCLPLVRSQPGPDAQCNTKVRQQMNTLTPYLDAGTVYGTSQGQLDQLLDQNSKIGKLKIGRLFPFGSAPANAPALPLVTQIHHSFREIDCPEDVHKPPHVPCFYAGDLRVNENPALASFHTLFLRMHNSVVEALHAINPRWSRERLFNNGRMIVAAVTQRIAYKEYLPQLLGQDYMRRFGLNALDRGYWSGYDPEYDATTSNALAAAALRFGHTLVTSPLSRPSTFWRRQGNPFELKDHFFNSNPLLTTTSGGANSVLRGLCADKAETADTTFVDDLHNFLMAPTGRLGSDLLAINMQRGRDHGIPGYNTYREFCGLKRARRFSDFVEIPRNLRNRLQRVYNNRVDDVDLYIASLAERNVRGGIFGPTFSCILGYQFRDFRRGDRLWHENGGSSPIFTPAQLKSIREYTLSRLLCDELNGMRTIQRNPFMQFTLSGNGRISCSSFPKLNLEPWRENYYGFASTGVQYENTAWFPGTHKNFKFTARTLHQFLLSIRPDGVCSTYIRAEQRTVRRKKQFRYVCNPGTIKATDYPNVDSSKGVWSEWEDQSTSGKDDLEIRDQKRHPCVDPIAIQVFTTSGRPARTTGQVFRTFSPSYGFECRGDDQKNGYCFDYQVRYFCKRLVPTFDPNPPFTFPPTNPPPFFTTTPFRPPTPSPFAPVWTPWISTDDPQNGGDYELLGSVNRRRGFCRRPFEIQVRTVATHRTTQYTNEIYRYQDPRYGFVCLNIDQGFQQTCSNYEVRYRCYRKDINI